MKQKAVKKAYKKSGNAMGRVCEASLQIMKALDKLRELEELWDFHDYNADGSIGPVVTGCIAEAEDALDAVNTLEENLQELFEEIEADAHSRGLNTNLVKIG